MKIENSENFIWLKFENKINNVPLLEALVKKPCEIYKIKNYKFLQNSCEQKGEFFLVKGQVLCDIAKKDQFEFLDKSYFIGEDGVVCYQFDLQQEFEIERNSIYKMIKRENKNTLDLVFEVSWQYRDGNVGVFPAKFITSNYEKLIDRLPKEKTDYKNLRVFSANASNMVIEYKKENDDKYAVFTTFDFLMTYENTFDVAAKESLTFKINKKADGVKKIKRKIKLPVDSNIKQWDAKKLFFAQEIVVYNNEIYKAKRDSISEIFDVNDWDKMQNSELFANIDSFFKTQYCQDQLNKKEELSFFIETQVADIIEYVLINPKQVPNLNEFCLIDGEKWRIVEIKILQNAQKLKINLVLQRILQFNFDELKSKKWDFEYKDFEASIVESSYHQEGDFEGLQIFLPENVKKNVFNEVNVSVM